MEAWNVSKEDKKYVDTLLKAKDIGAEFDARIYNVPKEEIANYIFWRQDDATRNSIQMLGRAYFSDKEMQKKSNNQVQDMLMVQHGINWNNLPIPQKRGTCCIREDVVMNDKDGNEFIRKKWKIDKSIPIFTGTDREYIEKHIFI
jgi:tRNA(His) 5'-end guanylyltransferase